MRAGRNFFLGPKLVHIIKERNFATITARLFLGQIQEQDRPSPRRIQKVTTASRPARDGFLQGERASFARRQAISYLPKDGFLQPHDHEAQKERHGRGSPRARPDVSSETFLGATIDTAHVVLGSNTIFLQHEQFTYHPFPFCRKMSTPSDKSINFLKRA